MANATVRATISHAAALSAVTLKWTAASPACYVRVDGAVCAMLRVARVITVRRTSRAVCGGKCSRSRNQGGGKNRGGEAVYRGRRRDNRRWWAGRGAIRATWRRVTTACHEQHARASLTPYVEDARSMSPRVAMPRTLMNQGHAQPRHAVPGRSASSCTPTLSSTKREPLGSVCEDGCRAASHVPRKCAICV